MKKLILLISSLIVAFQQAHAEIVVPQIFGEEMVLQRDMDVTIWGWANPGEEITVEFKEIKKTAVAKDNGTWQIKLPPMAASSVGATLKVSGKADTINLKDVLVGDVWLCSGQSNMEWPLCKTENAEKEIAAANYPEIRICFAQRTIFSDAKDCKFFWRKCSSASVRGFSAVAYYFGKELYKDIKVPIGLIDNSWGGSSAEAWVSRPALEAIPELKPCIDKYDKAMATYPQDLKLYQEKMLPWYKSFFPEGDDSAGFKKGFHKPDFDSSSWHEITLPLDNRGQVNPIKLQGQGALWLRKKIVIPEAWQGKNLTAELGYWDDYDETYFNGSRVGVTDYRTKRSWASVRKYQIPASAVKAGESVIAVHTMEDLFSTILFGKKGMKIYPEGSDNADFILLEGTWKYMAENVRSLEEQKKIAASRPVAPHDPLYPYSPGVLFNARLKSILPFSIRGIIWYQGESNTREPGRYKILFSALIQDWRKHFSKDDLPFLFVQLANFLKPCAMPGESKWAELREAQLSSLKIPYTAMAVAIDLGEENNIHPSRKGPVGKRLALAALAKVYDRDLVYSGPIYQSMSVEKNKIRIIFNNTGSGLMAKGGALKQFAIAGDDKKFVWVDAVIENDSVIVSSPEIRNPVAVRYAWADNPEGCNLYNKEGLPASPFRTDRW